MDQRIQFAILTMKEHRQLSVENLARSVDLSVSRFHHLFKAETSMTPMHCLRTLRMEYAHQLVLTSTLSLKEIMNTVGVEDRSHFDREFKKAFGITPTQCKRAARYNLKLAGTDSDSSLGHKTAELAIRQ